MTFERRSIGRILTILALASEGCMGTNGAPAPIDEPAPVRPTPTPPIVDPIDPPPPARDTPTFPVDTDPVGGTKECRVDLLSPPQVYGGKVKGLLSGMPLTDDELKDLKDDPAAIREVIDAALADPRSDEVLRRFFMMAFQQDQVGTEGLSMMTNLNNVNLGIWPDTNESVSALLTANMEESFARTALKIVREGRPFSDVLTTDTFEMTTGLMLFYSYLDHRHVNDDDTMFTRPIPEVTTFVGLRNAADEPSPEEILDPTSPGFMHFYLPLFDDLCLAGDVDEMPFLANGVANPVQFIFLSILGRHDTVRNRAGAATCRAMQARRPPLVTQADFSDWRSVRIRTVGAGQDPIRFYRLSQLRAANELLSHVDRVGFFTTLGFFGTWPTNEDNSSRVTLNQTLIGALGASFDGVTVTDFSPPNLDAEHSAPGSTCYGCHQTLDPMREFFRQTYSASYGEQHDVARQNLEAVFVFGGVQANGMSGVKGLSRILADHPAFPKAWAQKLCYYAISAPCPESAELDAIVASFAASGLDFRVLVRELYASPLITNAACVEGRTGLSPSIARRGQFCAIISARLGIPDVCALDTPPRARTGLQRAVSAAAISIPADTVSRGEPRPITISETGLFIRATHEVACQRIGESGFDPKFRGLAKDVAIAKMVEELMGLVVSDPRHDEAIEVLTEHVRDGIAAGASERDALRSALVVACMSPGMAGIGI